MLFSDNILCAFTHCWGLMSTIARLDPQSAEDLEKFAGFRRTEERTSAWLWKRAVDKHGWAVEQIDVPRLAEDGGGHVPVVLHRPKEPLTAGPLPLVFWFHGGGMCMGSAKGVCGGLLKRFEGEVVVASVDYRMAPECPFPAGPVDCITAVSWLVERCEELGFLRNSVCLAGSSGGGHFTALTAQAARERDIAIKYAYIHIPCVRYGATTRSYVENGSVSALPTEIMLWFWRSYVPDMERDARRASPILGRLEGLPPCMVVTCTVDPLRDEGIELYEALKAAGVDVAHCSLRGSHSFGPLCDSEGVENAWATFRKGMLASPASTMGRSKQE